MWLPQENPNQGLQRMGWWGKKLDQEGCCSGGLFGGVIDDYRRRLPNYGKTRRATAQTRSSISPRLIPNWASGTCRQRHHPRLHQEDAFVGPVHVFCNILQHCLAGCPDTKVDEQADRSGRVFAYERHRRHDTRTVRLPGTAPPHTHPHPRLCTVRLVPQGQHVPVPSDSPCADDQPLLVLRPTGPITAICTLLSVYADKFELDFNQYLGATVSTLCQRLAASRTHC
eukprot:COSAG02_NODE_699_length_18369_cov_9.690203_7_plen_227_part_00